MKEPNFRFSKQYVKEGMEFNGPRNPNARTMAIPKPYLWVMRLQWGVWSILATMSAQVDFAALFDDILYSNRLQKLSEDRAT